MINYTDDDGEGCDGEVNDDDKSIHDDDDDAVHTEIMLTKTRTVLPSQFVARRRYTPESFLRPRLDGVAQSLGCQIPIAHNNDAGYVAPL